MFKKAFESFENGLSKCVEHKDKGVFEAQISELIKIKNTLKNEMINAMKQVKFIGNEEKFELKVVENTKNIIENSNLFIEKEKEFEDYFKPVFHASYSYDFLKLKNIDGKLLKHDEQLISQNEPEANLKNRKVRFSENEIISNIVFAKRSILKLKKASPSKVKSQDFKKLGNGEKDFDDLD